MILANLT